MTSQGLSQVASLDTYFKNVNLRGWSVGVDGHREDLSNEGCLNYLIIRHFVFICEQGGTTRDPPDQSQDEGLSGANNSQATPPVPVPAIVKVGKSNFDHFLTCANG